ncbi:hypothetical protein DSC45_20400 [Streptomyces sp. YIM 130001]|uniref:hypothetical protein n=1 Tax=Streptomyces sp. YIM 130001 TaxID=2259644 RepID=UPI000EDBBB64|nr:hypothetical protein [Streptomyces sp. YIM 130001]RII14717.1 hypothetical protein DSC45_20400 [Streptomyces sp. YIM 130001]
MSRSPAHTDTVEIACDESGSDGENLVNGNTDVFTHASVSLDHAAAERGLDEIFERVRSPASSAMTEYKANVLLRSKHRPALTWLLGPDGPLLGSAHVHVIDKRYFLLATTTALLTDEGPHTEELSLAAHRAGPATYGPERWQAFLTAANDLLRARPRPETSDPAAVFIRCVEQLSSTVPVDPSDPAARLTALLLHSRARAERHRLRSAEAPGAWPALDPLFPALLGTVEHWSAAGRHVAVVHDRQNTLTPERLDHVISATGGMLDEVRLVEARQDPRIGLADFLAGITRKIASDRLHGTPDAELTDLLRPYTTSAPPLPTSWSWPR